MSSPDLEHERDYYRQQCDAVGGQLVRLQQELQHCRRESRRHQVEGLLVRELHDLAATQVPAREIGERCLRIVTERLRLDWAAILHRAAGDSEHRILSTVGAADPAEPLTGAAGTELAPLRVETQDGAFVLLAGRRLSPRILANAASADEDRASLAIALNLYEGIAALRQATESLATSEACYRAIVDNIGEAILIVDLPEGQIFEANAAAARLFGLTHAALCQRNLADLPLGHPLDSTASRRHALLRIVDGIGQQFEWRLSSPLRDSGWYDVRLGCAEISGRPRLLMVLQDITERRRAEVQRHHDALHDSLTGLANRALILDRLHQCLARARRRGQGEFALLLMDLDHFKRLNDSFGHPVGDQLLIAVARRIETCLRPGDTLARLGGDEFVVLLDFIQEPDDAWRIVDRLRDAFAQPFTLGELEVSANASIGIVVNDGSQERAEDLLRDAELAMYEAKAVEKGGYRRFHPNMYRHIVERMQLENDLRRAIQENELRLYYQPLIALETGAVTGFEALVRWQHPRRGLVMPGDFIPLAEETGLILPLGAWVLETACATIARWQAAGGAERPFSISVNLSPRQLAQADLCRQLEEILHRTGCAPSRLCLEITESLIIDDVTLARASLDALRQLGTRLSMDDFGTGYSSLSVLHQFPIDVLKIDRSFIQRLLADRQGYLIAMTIVTLGHLMGMTVVAEGIETPEIAAILREMGCDIGQGYLYSRAVDEASAWRMLETGIWV